MTKAVLEKHETVPAQRGDVLEHVGNTPLLRLRRVGRDLPPGIEVYAKAEHLNPGGSVKDRAALAMILDGERAGRLTPDKVLLDATSGNTGIAYAMIGAARGSASPPTRASSASGRCASTARSCWRRTRATASTPRSASRSVWPRRSP